MFQEKPGVDENSYEICYNNACYLIGKQDWTGAEKKLKKAESKSFIHMLIMMKTSSNLILFYVYVLCDNDSFNF